MTPIRSLVLRVRRAPPGALSVVCLALAGLCALALHALNPDVNPTRRYVSEYANASHGWLLAAVLSLFAVGAIAFASALRAHARGRVVPGLLTLAGGLMLVAAVFSTDRGGEEELLRTFSGRVHGIAAIGSFVLLVAAIGLLSRALEADARLSRMERTAMPAAVGGLFLTGAVLVAAPDAHGARQRVFLLVVFTWLLVASRTLRDIERAARAEADAAGPMPPRPGRPPDPATLQ